MFGMTMDKLMLLGVLAAVLLGPERLPSAASSLAQLVRRVKSFAVDARERVAEELGSDSSDIDWRTLDPRQYDPRRIIREALLHDGPVGRSPASDTVAHAPAITPESADSSSTHS